MSRLPFRRTRQGSVEVRLDPDESDLLASVLGEVLELLDDGQPEVPSDPLAAALGIGVATEAPTDAALARLLPDAYPEDPQAAGEFRRYTELGLRERKRAALRTVLAGLAAHAAGERVLLDQPALLAWLSAINDARLALGARLDVQEDWVEQAAQLEEGDPALYSFAVYEYLSERQELLLRVAGDPEPGPRSSRA